jgi:hypothetical protein
VLLFCYFIRHLSSIHLSCIFQLALLSTTHDDGGERKPGQNGADRQPARSRGGDCAAVVVSPAPVACPLAANEPPREGHRPGGAPWPGESLCLSLSCLPCLPQIAPPVAVRRSIFVFVLAVEIATADQRLTAVACHSQLPQSPQQLRCPAAELPSHRLRYLAVCQGEFEYPDPEWYACLGQMDLHTHRLMPFL